MELDAYRLVVRLRRHRLEAWRRHRLIATEQIAVGKAHTPTPRGVFFVTQLLQQPDAHGVYGPYAYSLSAHSSVLRSFAGADGRVAIHGTNTPWLLGSSVSHGCIRMRNAAIRRLARLLPLGTPVLIRR